MIRTGLCSLLGIDYPIIQGGMAYISDATLASAVSDGGALGVISSMGRTPEELRSEIRLARDLTRKPFGVNIMLKSPVAADYARVVTEEKVAAVTTGAGNPSKYIQSWIDVGIKVLPVVPSVALARMSERGGASAVIVEGGEAGGHVGELHSMSLIPQAADGVDLPVVAAGGIGDGRGLAAALMLGAQGVQMGTSFILARECSVHPDYKRAIINASDKDTTVICGGTGHPMRVIKNAFTRSCSDFSEEGAALLNAAFKRATEGDAETGCVTAGEISGLLTRERSAAEIIRDTAQEAEKLLLSASGWIE